MKVTNNLYVRIMLACCAAFGLVAGSYAGKITSTAQFRIILTSTCSTATATGKDFGTHQTTAASLTGVDAGTVTVNCPSGLAYTWGIDAGNRYGSKTANWRHMSSGTVANDIPYELYLSNGTTKIGDNGVNAIDGSYTDTTVAGQAAATGTGDGTDQTVSLKADVDIAASARVAGTYIDTVTVVVAW
ncbi:hypothetical protein TI03_01235 [Achromatium sp. WMS1]|nr:hypothetical protein TI03_01235 [Achromatium sp. WMS1]